MHIELRVLHVFSHPDKLNQLLPPFFVIFFEYFIHENATFTCLCLSICLSVCLFLSLSLSLTYAHAHTYTPARAWAPY